MKKEVGITFLDLLQILFIGLKLLGKIDWSWWWVLSPIWISFFLIIVIAVIVGVREGKRKYR